MSFRALWESLLPIGRDPRTGGYRRFSWTAADLSCRDWFMGAASARGLTVERDRDGNLWAWWDIDPNTGAANPGAPTTGAPTTGAAKTGAAPTGAARAVPREGAVATGSHLDSVPDGGAFDGPLGVVSAFAAVDVLRERGFTPARPVAVVAFTEEEGARFGVACLGSRLLTGAITAADARGLRDADGVSLAEAMTAAGAEPDRLGPDDDVAGRVAAFVELHIEQGRQLDGRGTVIGIGDGIWPHGRWRLDFSGRADHAGTTALPDRRDPMLPFAAAVTAARQAAARRNCLATFGKVSVLPGGVNAIGSAVCAWLDARAPDESSLGGVVEEIIAVAAEAATEHGVTVTITRESFSSAVEFDPVLRARLAAALAGRGIKAPALSTGAGHDAGVLGARIPTGMLFVRNPSGVSHAPDEHADLADCETGVAALAAVLEELTAQ